MARKPNLVYILADDMGYGDLSCLNPDCAFETPHFDEIARHGVAFTDAHATSAVCTPSRYGILTGRYNWRSRLKSEVVGGYSQPLIEPGRTTVASLLRRAGYKTAAVGKWHLGMDFAKGPNFTEALDYGACPDVDYSKPIGSSPVTNGFDYYYGISGSLDMPPYIYIENDRFTALPDHVTKGTGKGFFRAGPTAPDFVHEEVLDHLTDKALEVITAHKDEPFFLYFALPAPHTPILPAPQFRGKSHTNEYGDFVLHCDDVVGRVRNKLEELGLTENTILVYTSDNGCSPMANYAELLAAGHNPSYIFRGTKADIYEGGHRVPLLIQWPAEMPQGKTCDRVVCLCDLMATMADYLGLELGEAEGVDSVSNLSLWKDPAGPEVREDLVHQSIDGSLSIRKGHYKLEMCPGSGGWSDPKPGEEDPDAPRFQLYDLRQDVRERQNVILDHLDVAKELRARLKEHVLRGRSTPGPVQQNNGEAVWSTVRWLEEPDDTVL